MIEAVRKKDFPAFAEITMKDSNQFHATCLDTYPPIFYLSSVSKQIIGLVHRYNRHYGETRVSYLRIIFQERFKVSNWHCLFFYFVLQLSTDNLCVPVVCSSLTWIFTLIDSVLVPCSLKYIKLSGSAAILAHTSLSNSIYFACIGGRKCKLKICLKDKKKDLQIICVPISVRQICVFRWLMPIFRAGCPVADI